MTIAAPCYQSVIKTMLPSFLAHDIQNGLKQFLLTGFEPSDDFFHGLMQRFVDEESAWMKGPYLQLGLGIRIYWFFVGPEKFMI
jgi:hypothetical protein